MRSTKLSNFRPRRLSLLGAAVLVLAVALAAIAAGCGGGGAAEEDVQGRGNTAAAAERSSGTKALRGALAQARAEAGAPGLAAATFSADGTIIDQAAVGVRRSGESAPVTVHDRFQLGSDTKAMTAALVGRLQEKGDRLGFDTTLADAFPTLSTIDPKYARVTIAQLLSHTGGVDDDIELRGDDSAGTWPTKEQRALVAQLALEMPPRLEPGASSHYSNLGYVLAGAALEANSGMSWEELMRAEVFEPLGMDSCGFGEPGADGSDAPWGHKANLTPVDPTKSDESVLRSPIFGPAGGVYCSMADWATFLSELMSGLDGQSYYLRKETVERLFTPSDAPVDGDPDGQYALGWGVVDSPAGTVYTHDGSNQLWYASALLLPDADRGMIAVSNGPGPQGAGAQAAQAAIAAIAALYPASSETNGANS